MSTYATILTGSPLVLSFLYSPEDMLIDFREKGKEGERQRERERERNLNVKEKHQSVCVQSWGPNLQPRHVP